MAKALDDQVAVARLAVLGVTNENDEHWTAVSAILADRDVSHLRFNLSDMRAVGYVAKPGLVEFHIDGHCWQVDALTTVWWRRAGAVDLTGLGDAEALLVSDEAPHLLRGALLSAGVRWVDDPFVVARAETKQLQLSIAVGLGIRTPVTVVTNHLPSAEYFAARSEIVAKAVSPGRGIAPFVARIDLGDLSTSLGTTPTLLQELIDATADLRVVVVNDNVWAWRRVREEDTTDWRAVDPHGRGFSACSDVDAGLGREAIALNSALGLTMSVQDWLEHPAGAVFLEVNPQGAFLFLDGAHEVIAPVISTHLTESHPARSGVWPSTLRRFANDFLTKDRAPNNDGVVAPVFPQPTWIPEVACRPEALEVARSARSDTMSAAAAAEEKANRLAQTSLTLLAVNLALGGFQLSFAIGRGGGFWYFTLIPLALSLMFLSLAAIEAIEVDRVGVYRQPKLQDLAGTGIRDPTAVLLAAEEEARMRARWTADRKHSDVMQARAWFSRGIALLFVAGLLGAWSSANRSSSDEPTPTPPITSTP